jgi:hypothetical protein
MPLANWFDDFVKHFVHYVANASCERLHSSGEVFFSIRSALNIGGNKQEAKQHR